MLKDNVYTTLPQEDVVVKKSHLVEALSAPKKTRKTVTILSALLAVILIITVGIGIW